MQRPQTAKRTPGRKTPRKTSQHGPQGQKKAFKTISRQNHENENPGQIVADILSAVPGPFAGLTRARPRTYTRTKNQPPPGAKHHHPKKNSTTSNHHRQPGRDYTRPGFFFVRPGQRAGEREGGKGERIGGRKR